MKLKFFILPLLLALGLGPWALDLPAVIQNGVIAWTPDGAISHSIWRQNPGVTQPQYVATTTGTNYALPGPVAIGTMLYVRANQLLPGGQCCVESDLGFVVTPPDAPVPGTNVLRFVATSSVGYTIQSWDSAKGFWFPIATFTNAIGQTSAPAILTLTERAALRTKLTNLPPSLP